MNFSNIYKNKKVLITGHTGFKGSWLSLWLSLIGAKIYGISKDIPTEPSHFSFLNLKIEADIRLDISKSNDLIDIIQDIKPDFIFHLAAQPIVMESFNDPINTYLSNSMGTANLMEAIRRLQNNVISIIITSDKSYDNLEINRGYKEDDKLGGADPYSASKGAAELIISSYIRSFFKDEKKLVGIGRAGNVIGGGDWASGRIIPDIIKAIKNKEELIIRNPNATRPWQHVLEPLSGYMSLAYNLRKEKNNHGEAFNFGPKINENYTVEEVLKEINYHFTNLKWKVDNKNIFSESTLLKLNCYKAKKHLNWMSTLSFDESIKLTCEWYSNYLNNKIAIKDFSINQIKEYTEFAKSRKLPWSQY